jgi:hypothetical protein
VGESPAFSSLSVHVLGVIIAPLASENKSVLFVRHHS